MFVDQKHFGKAEEYLETSKPITKLKPEPLQTLLT